MSLSAPLVINRETFRRGQRGVFLVPYDQLDAHVLAAGYQCQAEEIYPCVREVMKRCNPLLKKTVVTRSIQRLRDEGRWPWPVFLKRHGVALEEWHPGHMPRPEQPVKLRRSYAMRASHKLLPNPRKISRWPESRWWPNEARRHDTGPDWDAIFEHPKENITLTEGRLAVHRKPYRADVAAFHAGRKDFTRGPSCER